MDSSKKFLSVFEVNRLARSLLEQVTVWVLGEVEGYEDGYKSAVYFDLKDAQASLPCMYWKNENVGYKPKDGEKILVFGTLSLYEKNGKYRMVAAQIEPFGEGELLRMREELKRKLLAEGYFSEENKRPIPNLPVRIGLITSKRGAAIEDFKTNVVKGYAGLEILFVDSIVQGDAAVKSIVSAFERLSKEKLDVVILTRGGGSIEDLMCFNTEEVVKAIRACPHPVISAVGHEVDYTLADLAADLRVSTPTKAAEYISSSFVEFLADIKNVVSLLDVAFERLSRSFLFELDLCEKSLKRTWAFFKDLPEEVGELGGRLKSGMKRCTSASGDLVSALLKNLNLLSPEGVIKRGYSITYNLNGKVVRSIGSVSIGEAVAVSVADGTLRSKVLGKKARSS